MISTVLSNRTVVITLRKQVKRALFKSTSEPLYSGHGIKLGKSTYRQERQRQRLNTPIRMFYTSIVVQSDALHDGRTIYILNVVRACAHRPHGGLMKVIINKIAAVFKRPVLKQEEPKELEPVTFVNNPITIEQQDLLGLSTAVNLIDDVVCQGASLIGVIADYGVGKSSLIEFVSRRKKRYRNVIRINLWDSLHNAQNTSVADGSMISSLSRSFIYQLAACAPSNKLGKALSKYVNYRLSQNYRTISFTTISWRRIIAAGVMCILSYFVYSIAKGLSPSELNGFLQSIGLELAPNTIRIFSIITPYLAMLLGGIGLIYIVKKGNITYTPMKQGVKKDVEINDLYDVYADVIGAVTRQLRRGEKLLIVIEDLDRITEERLVLEFVKELYRFQNLLDEEKRKEIVFVVTILPEAKLTRPEGKHSSEPIYSKVFDYVLNLHPYHSDDYSTIMLNIINGDDINKKKLEQALRLETIGDTLPSEFYWLLQGRNLTIRDLKDRLNQAVALMVTLRNKKYAVKSAVSFATCAAVTYLEHRYGKDFYNLLAQEDAFSALIQEALWTSNNTVQSEDRKNGLKDKIAKIIGITPDKAIGFCDDLAEMIVTRIVDNDFRMYFYSYPKESPISTNDEKDISRLLLYPSPSWNEKLLDDLVLSILKSDMQENIITKCLADISVKSIDFPDIVLANEYIFQKATEFDLAMILKLVVRMVSWQKDTLDSSAKWWSKIWSYSFAKKDELIRMYGLELDTILQNQSEDEIVSVRRALIDIMGEGISVYVHLFAKKSDDFAYPLITASELGAVETISTAIRLTRAGAVTQENYKYVLKGIVEKLDTLEEHTELFSLFDRVLKSIPAEMIAPFLLKALFATKIIRDAYTKVLSVGIEKRTIAPSDELLLAYINTAADDEWTEQFGQMVDALLNNQGYSCNVLTRLTEQGFYKSYLLTLEKENSLETISYDSEDVSKWVMATCSQLLALERMQCVTAVRRAIVEKSNGVCPDAYCDLFYRGFPIVTVEEIRLCSNFSDAVTLIDASNITELNYEPIIAFINSEQRSAEECKTLLNAIFPGAKEDGWFPPDELIESIVYGLDFTVIDFGGMDSDTKEKWIEKINDVLELDQGENAVKLMRHLRCLISSLETSVIESDMTTEYIALFNDIDTPTSKTVEWVTPLDIDFPLAPQIAKRLLDTGDKHGFIVGSTLYSGILYFSLEQFDLGVYLDIYKNNEDNDVFKIMSSNKEFLQYLIDNRQYATLDYAHTKPLWGFRQPFDLVKHVFSTISTEKQATLYLQTLPHFDTAEVGQEFVSLVKTDEKLSELLTSSAARYWVKERLWNPTQKMMFTRFMNGKYPGTGEEEFID